MLFTNNSTQELQQTKIQELEKRISFVSKAIEKIKTAQSQDTSLEQIEELSQSLTQLIESLSSLDSRTESLENGFVSLLQIQNMLEDLETSVLEATNENIVAAMSNFPQIVISQWTEI